jgi:hypothetical protein
MAGIKIEIDMSELDAARQKVASLLTGLDEIERRINAVPFGHQGASPPMLSATTSVPSKG